MPHSMLAMALTCALLLWLPSWGRAAQEAALPTPGDGLRLDALATRIERNDGALERQEARIEALSAKLFETLMRAQDLEQTEQRLRPSVAHAQADRGEPTPPGAEGLGAALALILGMLMPIGALLLAPGCARALGAPAAAAGQGAPAGDPAIQYLLAWLGAGLGYAVIGCGLMFGALQGDWLGAPSSLLLPELLQAGQGQGLGGPLTRLALELPLAGALGVIVCSAVPGRLSHLSLLLAAITLGALVYPLFGHWAGAHVIGADHRGWLSALGFADPGGCAGIAALAGATALALAARLGTGLAADAPHPGGGAAGANTGANTGAAIGALLLWLAWLGIALTMTGAPDAATLPALVLGTTAGATGVALALLIPGTLAHPPIGWERRLPTGLLVGAVVGSAGYATASALGLLLLGLATGALYNVVHQAVERRLGASAQLAAGFAVAGVCGTLAPSLLGPGGSLTVQLVGLAAALALGSVAGLLLAQLKRLTMPPRPCEDQGAP